MSSSKVVRVSQRIAVTILLIATLISKKESDYVVSNEEVVDTDYDFADVFDDTYLNTKLVIPKRGEGWACGWGKSCSIHQPDSKEHPRRYRRGGQPSYPMGEVIDRRLGG